MKIKGIPEGYEVVRFGRPSSADTWLNSIGGFGNGAYPEPRLIIRKITPVLNIKDVKFKKGWIAQDANGNNYWFSTKPYNDICCGEWVTNNDNYDEIPQCIALEWKKGTHWAERIFRIQ